jgi:lipoprotein-anchoring transpeptidase ErfK/SrfK
MIFHLRNAIFLCLLSAALFTSCDVQQNQPTANVSANSAAAVSSPAPLASPATPAVSPSPATVENKTTAVNLPVTLPVLDAMFADENFASELKTKLNLTDEQIEKLRQTARDATNALEEDENGSTAAATRHANEQIQAIVGADKTRQLADFVNQRSNDTAENTTAENELNKIPTDTRIVVNAPAYRMDVFNNGRLIKTYKIGIGYPEFPLPIGVRKADTIIFNPTWTPPDEPWVKGKVKAGKKVAAGDKLNPLGPIKIPIGSPSLIHGGKQAAKLGGFASHGCVGLTDSQVQDFAVQLAQIANTPLKPEDVKNYAKNKTETKNLKLTQAIPVELRYETITVEDGKLHIYRDVYEHGTNTEENLRKVLQANGVSFDSLSDKDRDKILAGLKQMARDAEGNVAEKQTNSNKKNESAKVTRVIKGAKEFVIELPALKGKGFPAPVNLSKN